MFEFPKIEFESIEKMNEYCLTNKDSIDRIFSSYKHILSHQHLHAQFIMSSNRKDFMCDNVIEIPINDLINYPLPRLIDRFLEENLSLFLNKG
jgi:adenine-specific DNA glycosylase